MEKKKAKYVSRMAMKWNRKDFHVLDKKKNRNEDEGKGIETGHSKLTPE